MSGVPPELVNIHSIDPTIEVELKYFGSDNFLGRPVLGYRRNICYLSVAAAKALLAVQKKLMPLGFGLKIFDGTRPQRAVQDILRWAQASDDLNLKSRFYPRIEKNALIEAGYLASRSSHTRGSAVDLTLIRKDNGTDVDMGGEFDFFDPDSHFDYPDLAPEPRANRDLLREIMTNHGFLPYNKEWWHFRLNNEPYPDTYFDFSID